jgi:hypothetical protein
MNPMKIITKLPWLVLAALTIDVAITARADEVTELNKILFDAAAVSPATSPLVITRVAPSCTRQYLTP